MTDPQQVPESAAGKIDLTGRLQKDGKPFGQEIKASIRSGGISFVYPSGLIKVGDEFRFLASPDRVIDFEVVLVEPVLGQGGETIDGRIARDDTYPVR